MSLTNHPNNTKKPFDREPISHWYREPWAWFIVGVIAVTVIWGSAQITIAVKHGDEVVVDDYYRVGKAINLDLSRDQRAADQQLEAVITVNGDNSLLVNMTGQLSQWPKQLLLRLIPAARNIDQDVLPLLQTPHTPSAYTGKVQRVPEGRYYVQLETLDQRQPEQGHLSGWRINREVRFDHGGTVTLSAIQPTEPSP